MVAESKPVWVLEEGAVYDGPFRANIESFISHFGKAIPLKCPGVRAWTILVVDVRKHASRPSKLYIYEDNAAAEHPPVCDHCRIIGKSSQPAGNTYILFREAECQAAEDLSKIQT